MPLKSLFDPLILQYFSEFVGIPTDIQAKAWPKIAAGGHLLITAPTGSGKTLCAFLWALNQLLTGAWPRGKTSVLYVSPLKALGVDISRNLQAPLTTIQKLACDNHRELQEISIGLRTGDTSEEERRRQAKCPPEILVTTPESLNLLLSSARGRRMLCSLKTVILDEIHDVASEKRGTYLISAIERLTLLSGEFQRIALSATVKPLESVAQFIGGFTYRDGCYTPRAVEFLTSNIVKQTEVTVDAPDLPDPSEITTKNEDDSMARLAARLLEIILSHKTTLIFANSRRRVEKVARLINEAAAQNESLLNSDSYNPNEPIAYAHHGSLSRELRADIEARFKVGALRALVATKSLELGIDIGQLDQVILLDAPPTLASGIQRMGRAGHRIDAKSQAVVFPTHAHAFCDAAAMAPLMEQGALETLHIPQSPLDVLAQIIAAEALNPGWTADELFDFIRQISSYRFLNRELYDSLLNMLTGRFADTRLRELRPRLFIHPTTGAISAKPGMKLVLCQQGGVIPDRGLFNLRLKGGGILGELDEEFVWERRLGETFTFGTSSWHIEEITPREVIVTPAQGRGIVVFWKGDEFGRPFELMDKIGSYLEELDSQLSQNITPELPHLTKNAQQALVAHLTAQRQKTGVSLPHRHHVVAERFPESTNRSSDNENSEFRLAFHALWGAQILKPLSICLRAAFQETFGMNLDIAHNDEAMILLLPGDFKIEELFAPLRTRPLRDWLKQGLENTGYFAARFRECASTALLLPKSGFHQRTPLWLSRLRSKRLLESVSQFDDFPITAETWRTCLDSFDLKGLEERLAELESGEIALSEVVTSGPSPFVEDVLWYATNDAMYRDETPNRTGPASVRTSVLDELLGSPDRPTIPNSLNLEFSQQWRRLAPGFAPRSLEELSEHLEQRLWIDHEELTALQKASARDTGNAFTFNELDLVSIADFSGELMLAKRFSARIQAAQTGDSNALEFVLAERLKSEAIISPNEIRNAIHVSSSALREALEVLENKGEIISGLLTETATEPEICDRQNFELLLRKLRDRNHSTLSIRPISELPIFTAEFLGLTQPESGELALQKSLEQLLALEVPLDTMETALLPARMNDFRPAALDHTFQETDLLWYGARDSKENPKVAFAFADQLDCARETNAENFAERPFDLAQLQSEFGFAEGEKQLWNRVFTGCCTTNSLGPIRRAQTRDFAPAPVQRSGFRRWSKRSEDTIWQPLPKPANSDQVAEAELAMERARILLSRYGVVFRERLEREAPKMRWSAVARAFRRMEYAGEVVSGPFFDTILGAQYASKSAVAALRKSSEPAAWWISSLDPLSPSGLPGFEGFPVRSAKTALFFFDSDLVIVGRKNGAELEIRNRDKIAETLEALKRYARRLPPNDLPGADNDFEIEKIDQSPAAQSNFAEIFTAAGFKRRYQSLVLIR